MQCAVVWFRCVDLRKQPYEMLLKKKVYFKILQNSQANACAWYFSLKSCNSDIYNFYQRESPFFSSGLCKIFKNTFFIGHLSVTTSKSWGFSPAPAHLHNVRMRFPFHNFVYFNIYNQEEKPIGIVTNLSFFNIFLSIRRNLTLTFLLTYLFYMYLLTNS